MSWAPSTCSAAAHPIGSPRGRRPVPPRRPRGARPPALPPSMRAPRLVLAPRAAWALAPAATVSLQMAAWFTNHAEPERALDAGRYCAVEAGRLRLPPDERPGLALQAGRPALA